MSFSQQKQGTGKKAVVLQQYLALVVWSSSISLIIEKICRRNGNEKQKDSLETRADLVVLRTYVENQAILQPILLYRALKCKQTKEHGKVDCFLTPNFTFF